MKGGILQEWKERSSYKNNSVECLGYMKHAGTSFLLELTLLPVEMIDILSAMEYTAAILVGVIEAGLLGTDTTQVITDVLRSTIRKTIGK